MIQLISHEYPINLPFLEGFHLFFSSPQIGSFSTGNKAQSFHANGRWAASCGSVCWHRFKKNSQTMAGWWFGTWILFFSHILGIIIYIYWEYCNYWEYHHPNWWSPSFFRGVAKNHQPDGDSNFFLPSGHAWDIPNPPAEVKMLGISNIAWWEYASHIWSIGTLQPIEKR